MQLSCTGPGLVQTQQFAGIAVEAGWAVADLADTAGLRLQGGQFGGGIKFHRNSGVEL